MPPSRLSRDISALTYRAAYAPFKPNKSGQRLPPTYYRGCWHVVSRGLFTRYLQLTPQSRFIPWQKQFTTHNAFFLHAAWLDQALTHCPIFPTAASRRSLARISVPVWGDHPLRSPIDHRLGSPLHCQLTNQTHAHLLPPQF